MNKWEAAVISTYTGIMLGDFSEMHKYMEKIYGAPIWTHRLSNTDFVEELKELSKEDFLEIHSNIV